MRVLVTGGAGFIGKHVCRVLRDRGMEPVSFDHCLNGPDVRDHVQVMDAAQGCSHVIHLAGVLGTAELFDAPHEAVDVNVHGTLNVLQACERLGLGYVGITMPDCWDNVYQATKLCGRRLAASWHRHQGLPVSHVRAFNAYGEGQKIGPVQKIIPTFADRAGRGEPIPVWGDGTQQVDLVWAGDIARMLVDAMAFTRDEVFDAGTGVGQSVLDVVQRVLRQTGSSSEIQFLPMRAGEHPAKVIAQGEGWDLLGWHPEPREDELSDAINSYLVS